MQRLNILCNSHFEGAECKLRMIYRRSQYAGVSVCAQAKQAHIEVIEARLRPLIRTGVDIVLDRYWLSTWVYANFDRVPQHTINLLLELEMQSWEWIRPSMVFLILRDEPS